MKSDEDNSDFLYTDDSDYCENASILKITPIRIVTKNKIIELLNTSEKSKIIFNSLSSALLTDWFNGLNELNKPYYLTTISIFISWLNKVKIINKNSLSIIKDFESHRVNNDNLKPQSTGADKLLVMIKKSFDHKNVSGSDILYLTNILNFTKLSLNEDPVQTTLTSFFSSIPWLKQHLSEETYYRLESPKRLMDSFSITISSTLLYLINCKNNKLLTKLANSYIEPKYTTAKSIRDYWGRELISTYRKLATQNDNQYLRDLIIGDLVNKNMTQEVISWIKNNPKSKEIPFRLYKNGRYQDIFVYPSLLSKNDLLNNSELEEILFSWLCAWQSIQPSDIYKLKKGDFALHRNNNNRVISIQCSYYKSRSQVIYEPEPINTNSIEGQAILSYLELFNNDSDKLFNIKPRKCMHFTYENYQSIPSLLFNLLNSKHLPSIINENLEKRKSSNVFSKTYLAIIKNSGPSYSSWAHHERSKGLPFCIKTYRHSVKNHIPLLHFSTSAVKNSAVHSRTDKYRDGDLVNFNSHTNETEKYSYLTDENKEWVNQHGRITRLVLDDLENYSYKPDIYKSINLAKDKTVRTRIIKHTRLDEDKPEKIKTNDLFDEILILDTPETVVNMLHYIQQVEVKHSSLINNALEYFEKTVLPTTEWMHYVINQMMTAKTVQQGRKEYDSIKGILPPLFAPQLGGSL